MSYDLYLVHVPPDISAEAVGEIALAVAEGELPSEPLDSISADTRDRVVAALRASNPNLHPFVFDFADIAKLQEISESEARLRFQHVELNGPDDGNGIQITVYGTWASVTVPYWHQGPRAEIVWDEIWGYLRILSSVGGFQAYDPQLDRPLDLAIDRSEVILGYEQTVEATLRMVQSRSSQDARRPWWKFW